MKRTGIRDLKNDVRNDYSEINSQILGYFSIQILKYPIL